MLKFKTNPLRIDHSHKLVLMTEDQVADNKYQLIKDKPSGYKTKPDGYSVSINLVSGQYIFPYTILFEILWQAIRCLQVMFYTHGCNEEFKAMTARVYHLHQLLIPDAAGIMMPPPVNFSEMLAEDEGLTLLKEVIAMSDADRDSLLDKDRVEELKTYPNAATLTVKCETFTVPYLANFIRYGCEFLMFDAKTTTRHQMRMKDLMETAIPCMLFADLLTESSATDAVDVTVNSIAGVSKDIVEHYLKLMTL